MKNKSGRAIDVNKRFVKTHGKSGQSIYNIWLGMVARCNNVNQARYADYGGRGIKVCKRWLKFKNFYADMGDRPKGKTLDRINNDGDYKPSNCRWATRVEQGANTRRSLKQIVIDGESMTLKQAAQKFKVDYRNLWWRLKRGWTIEQACKTKLELGRNKRP